MKKVAMIITLMLLFVVYLRDPMVLNEEQRFKVKLLDDEYLEIYEDGSIYGQAVNGKYYFIPIDNIASVVEVEDVEPD